MIHKIIRNFSSKQKAVSFGEKAKKHKCVDYVKAYVSGGGHYACMVCSSEGFTEEAAKELVGRGRNYADLMV